MTANINLNDIKGDLKEIKQKLDDELNEEQSWKYYLFSGAAGGALQGGLQIIGFDFDPRSDLDNNDPLHGTELNPGLEWILFFLIITLAGAILGSVASFLVNGDVTKKNLTRVCVVSAAFGLFFPATLNLIEAYVDSQSFVQEQKQANKEISQQLLELNKKLTSNPNLVSTVQEKEKLIDSYETLSKFTTDPKISRDSIKNLEQIGIQNENSIIRNKVLDSLISVEQQNLLIDKIDKDLVQTELLQSIQRLQ